KLLTHPEYGLNIVGFIDAQPRPRDPDLEEMPVLGTCRDVPEIARALDVDRVVIAFSGERHADLLRVVKELTPLDVQVDIVPRPFEAASPNVHLHLIEGLPLLGLPPVRLSRSSRLVKRALDLVVAGLALVVLAPLLALIAIAVKIDSRGSVLYRHRRV